MVDGCSDMDESTLRRRYDDLRARWANGLGPIATGDTPTMVVSVYNGGAIPASLPAQFLCHPVVMSGAESEGGAVVATAAIPQHMVVTVVGTSAPSVGDLLLARQIDGRWVAERYGSGATNVVIPGCACSSTPRTLTMTVVVPDATAPLLNSCTIVYGPTPSSLSAIGLGANSYLSTSMFADPTTGDSFWHYFYCSSGYYTIRSVYPTSAYGSPYRSAILFRWPIGAGGNTCSPLNLLTGQVYSGGDIHTTVHLTG